MAVMKESVNLVCLARYLLRSIVECENEGGNAKAYCYVFHLTVKVLHGVLTGRIDAESLVPLMMFLDKSAFGGIMRLDSAKRKSQKGGGDGKGHWVTINGTHVQIGKNGEITKGPASLKGQTAPESKAQTSKPQSGGNTGKTGKATSGKKYSEAEYKKALIGSKTSDGKIVKGITHHAMSRMKERDIFPQSVRRSLENATPVPGNVSGRSVYDHKGTRVVVDDSTSYIWTVIYTGKEGK